MFFDGFPKEYFRMIILYVIPMKFTVFALFDVKVSIVFAI